MNKPVRLPPPLDAITVLESSTDNVYLVDREWRITYMNRRAVAEVADGRELVDMSLWDAFPDLATSAFAPGLREAMAGRRAVEMEDYYPAWGKWFAANMLPLADGLAVFFRETTARRQSEEALIASEERFRVMFETLTQGVVYQDRNNVVIDANPAAQRILGLSLDQLKGRSSADPRWRAVDTDGNGITGNEHPARIALTTGRTVRGYVMGAFNPQRGEMRWLRVDAVPQFRPGESEPYQVYALFSDITEQHLAEEALRKSRAHLAAAQRVACVGSAQADFRTDTWEWSEECYRIYGQDRATFIPTRQNIVELVYPDDREKFLRDIEESRRGIDAKPLEYRIVRPSGEIRTIYREVELFRDQAGQVIGGVATKQDVTDIRAAARQREDLQKQLLHAQRMDALGTLAGGIAHDLNNTLLPVLALSELVQSSLPAEDPNRELLDVVRSAADKARGLVRQVLAFSRQEPSDKRELDLGALLRETMPLLRASVPATIRIEEEIEALPPVLADAAQLHQVVLNLITNAAQAIGEDSGKITISAHLSHDGLAARSGDRQRWICLSVADTGCGMNESVRKRMFEPFFTTKAAGEGTGLGLSVVHGIMTDHGGSIQVSSQPRKGTSVDLYLPAVPERGMYAREAEG
jgi:two-component system cell cycle sensor histidine kinase/response regulator CckA